MDNLCHTLVGAALAEAGLKRRTRLGAATLMIGANFPDIDVIAVPLGASLTFRRGWTHGVLALVVLPFVLAGIMMWWDRRRAARQPQLPRAVPRELVLLSAISILTHPALDYLNTYGMRWLMPFSGRWFYGDSLFIVDPWLWLVLFAGVIAARRTPWGPAAARGALGVSGAYIVAMMLASALTRARVLDELRPSRRAAPSLMIAPVAVNPLRRDVLYDAGNRSRLGTVRVLPPRASLPVAREIVKGRDDPAVAAALGRPEIQRFLSWSRFPFFEVERDASGVRVRAADARYAAPGGASWASVTVRLPRVIAEPPR